MTTLIAVQSPLPKNSTYIFTMVCPNRDERRLSWVEWVKDFQIIESGQNNDVFLKTHKRQKFVENQQNVSSVTLDSVN